MWFAILSLLLGISSYLLLGPIGFIVSLLSITFGLISIKKKFSKLAVAGIILSCISLAILLLIVLGSAIGLIEVVEDPEISSGGYEIIDGTILITIIAILITIALYTLTNKEGVLRPAIAGVILSVVGFLISLINPYLAIFMLVNSYIFAFRELLWIRSGVGKNTSNFGQFKKQSTDWQAVLGMGGLAFISFFSGMWLIFSIREALGMNVHHYDPVTGEGLTEANWVFVYLGFWALLGVSLTFLIFIREYGLKMVVISTLKFITIGDWTLMFETRSSTEGLFGLLIRVTRGNLFARFISNLCLRLFVLFIIFLIIIGL